MAEGLLVYETITNESAKEFLRELNFVSQFQDDITVRINSGGGDVFAGYGMVAAVSEIRGETLGIVDGLAGSMAGVFLPMFDRVEAYDTSNFLIHRIASPGPVTNEMQAEIDRMNVIFREKLESRIKPRAFKRIFGTSIKGLFEEEERRDLLFGAQKALEIGLIDRIRTLNREEGKKVQAAFSAFASGSIKYELSSSIEDNTAQSGKKQKSKPKTMSEEAITVESLRVSDPAVYQAIFNSGLEAGSKKERDRVGAWNAFADVDLNAVTEGIKSGEPLGQAKQMEFLRKSVSAGAVQQLEAGSAGNIATTVTTEVAADGGAAAAGNPQAAGSAVSEFEAAVMKSLNLKAKSDVA